MKNKPIALIDASDQQIATLNVSPEGDRFEGSIGLSETPAHMVQVFQAFEEIVEGQILSLLDDVEAKVTALSLRVRLEDGSIAQITDLQVYPSANTVSFKTKHPLPV